MTEAICSLTFVTDYSKIAFFKFDVQGIRFFVVFDLHSIKQGEKLFKSLRLPLGA